MPDTILLPDSLGPLRPGYHLAFGSSTDNIYVASESSDIMVVDGNTFQRIKRIHTGTPVGGALLVSQHNRLYCSYPKQGRIGVIDCATNTVIGTIPVGTCPTSLCYSTSSDKLYCSDTIDCTVSVIDCADDVVMKAIHVGNGPTAIAYEPTTNKLYAGTPDALLAVSCSRDSIIATISSVKGARGLCVNKHLQKVYVAGVDSAYTWTMSVVSAVSDSLLTSVPAGGNVFPRLVCNEVTDRLYEAVNSGSEICEFDCVGDTYTRVESMGGLFVARGLVSDSVNNRLYYLLDGEVVVMDCASMRGKYVILVNGYLATFEIDPARYRVMFAGGNWESVLTALDYKGDSLRAVGGAPLCGWNGKPCRNTAEGKLYYWWGPLAGGLGVIDEQTKRVIKLVSMPQAASDFLIYSRLSNKLYFPVMLGPWHGQTGIGVMDGSMDSLLKVIEFGDGHPPSVFCYCPEDDKTYWSVYGGARTYVAAVDCRSDSVVSKMDVSYPVDGMQYLGNHHLLLWEKNERLILLDSRTDSVLVDSAMSGICAVAHTGDGEKVYVVRGHRLEVRGSNSLDLLATVDWVYDRAVDPFLMCADSTSRLCWFVRDQFPIGPDSVLTIDTHGDTAVGRLGVGFMQAQGCLDHSGRYVLNPDPANDYYQNPDSNSLIIYDTQSDSVAAIYGDLPVPNSVTPNQKLHRIYVGCQDVMLVYPDAPPGVQETQNAKVRPTKCGPTVVRGVLVLDAVDSRQHAAQRADLLNVGGRKVMDLRPGANDVRALAPGVYFVREEPQAASSRPQAVRKVVVAR
ncbi:MAG TPA: YncE family protein [bacterium]|nr:YncE family protein [bacterium]